MNYDNQEKINDASCFQSKISMGLRASKNL